MGKLSVVISAYNEELKINKCLESVKKIADEIIFVDNSSTDKTAEIARKAGAKVFVRENNPMLNVSKNFGISKATGDWVLYLDADEQVSPKLEKEISSIVNNGSETSGYQIPRKNIIFGQWIKHSGWYPDYQVRFFKKGKGKFPEKHVHEMIEIQGKIANMENNLMHYNFETIAQFLHKHINIYAPNEAGQLIKNGYVFNWQDAIRFPVSEFLSRFFARQGYKDGFHGLMLSMLMAFYHLIIFVFIWEKEGFKDPNINALEEAEKEFKKTSKEIIYWFFNEKIKASKNLLRKTSLKLQRKFSK